MFIRMLNTLTAIFFDFIPKIIDAMNPISNKRYKIIGIHRLIVGPLRKKKTKIAMSKRMKVKVNGLISLRCFKNSTSSD